MRSLPPRKPGARRTWCWLRNVSHANAGRYFAERTRTRVTVASMGRYLTPIPHGCSKKSVLFWSLSRGNREQPLGRTYTARRLALDPTRRDSGHFGLPLVTPFQETVSPPCQGCSAICIGCRKSWWDNSPPRKPASWGCHRDWGFRCAQTESTPH
jgi:hypothetical protein